MKLYFFRITSIDDFVKVARIEVLEYLREYYGITGNYMCIPDNIKGAYGKYSCEFTILSENRNLLIWVQYIDGTNYLTINSYNQDMSHKIKLKSAEQYQKDKQKSSTHCRLIYDQEDGWKINVSADQIAKVVEERLSGKDGLEHNKSIDPTEECNESEKDVDD